MTGIGTTSTVDPTTLSVVWNRLDQILTEIGEKVLHATQSFVMANVRDLGQSFLNRDGELVAVAAFLPSHMFISEVAIKGFLEKFGDDLHPGDLMIGNDPYIVRSGHLPDWTFIRPIFYGRELLGFFQFRGHMADTGGFLPGGYAPGAYDIIAEGLNIPPIRIIKAGVVDEELWGLVLRNVRNPDVVRMDAMLINGAMEQGDQDLIRLVERYGSGAVLACMDEMIAAGERAARAEIAKIPDGDYYGESATDWDGQTDRPVWVRAKLTVEGESLTFDLSESDPQATFVNTPWGTTLYAATRTVFAMIDPHVPKNHGSMKQVSVVTKPGTVVHPIYPATVGASGISVGGIITEACQLALAQALPDASFGMFARHLCPINVGMDPDTIDPRTGTIRQYFAEHFASDGSAGAFKGYDGWPGIGYFGFVGCLVRADIEVFETQVPFWVRRYELLTDWEGAGEFRGGPGVYVEMIASDRPPEAPALLTTGNSDGSRFPPRGAAGGLDGPKAEMWIENPETGGTRILPTMANMFIAPGEICHTRAPGGGGWGNPLHRNSERVLADVVDGLVSADRAKQIYGVVVDPATLTLDLVETARLRQDRMA